MSDEVIANDAFNRVGPDWCAQLVSRKLVSTLEDRFRHGEQTDRSFISHPGFGKILGRSESQQAKVSELTGMARSDLQHIRGNHDDELQKLSISHWESPLEVLSAEQLEKAMELLGKPAFWFFSNLAPQFLQVDYRSGIGGTTVVSQKVLELERRLGKKYAAMTDDELAENDIELFDSLVYGMFFNETVWGKLLLSDEQVSALKGEFRNQIMAQILVTPNNATQRMEDLLEGVIDYPPSLENFLHPPQREWFRQLELQIRLGSRFSSTAGLLSPEITDRLGVSTAQISRLADFAWAFEEKARQVSQAKSDGVSQRQQQLVIELLGLLDEPQRDLYQRYLYQRYTGNDVEALIRQADPGSEKTKR